MKQITNLQANEDELERLAYLVAKNLDTQLKQPKRYMNIKETTEYMNVSYNTLKLKFVPEGLRSVLIDGLERFDKLDCDTFMETHKH